MSVGWRLRLGKGFRQCCALKLSQMSLGLKRKKKPFRTRCFSKRNKQPNCGVSGRGLSFSASLWWCLCVSMFASFFLFSVSLQIWLSLLPCACLCVLTISLAFRSLALPQAFLSSHGAFSRRCFTNQTHPVSWFCSFFTVFHPNYSFFLSYFAPITLVAVD